MTEWLRPVFGRARTPMQSVAGSAASFDDESEDVNPARPRPASRVSSYIGLRVNTPPIHNPDSFPNFRKPDSVFHEPSVPQMAEILKVTLMSQGTFAPLPLEYNSCILHVLEAYQGMQKEIERKEEELEAMKYQHTETIKEFEDMATRWEAKEKDYQAELKNLEVVLSKTKDGMEKVSLARSKSAVHGSKKIREVVRDMRSIKQTDFEMTKDSLAPADSGHPLYVPQDEGQRQRLNQKQRKARPIGAASIDTKATGGHHGAYAQNQILSPPPLRVHETTKANFQSEETFMEPHPSFRGMASHGDGRQLWAQASNSDSDSSESSDERASLKTGALGQRYVVETDLEKQPEASSPLRKLKRGVGEQAERAKNFMRHPSNIPSQMGFSFKTGDDLSILGKHKIIEDGRTRRSASEQTSQTNLGSEISNKPARRSSAIPKPIQEHVKGSPSPDSAAQEDRTLNRFNSTSSVLTAFRAGSGRNSSDEFSRSNSVNSHKHSADRKSSSEAVVAAARAVARSTRIFNQQHISSEPGTKRPSPNQRLEQS